MQQIKNIWNLLLDFDLNNIWIRSLFYLLVSIVAFFVVWSIGGNIIYWKIIAQIKKTKVRSLQNKPGINLHQNLKKEDNLQNDENQIFSNSPGNFLSIYFSIGSSLKAIAQKFGNTPKDSKQTISLLLDKKIITKFGKKKIKNLDWMATMINNGKIKHFEKILMADAVKLAWAFHKEINLWMRSEMR